MVIGNILNSIVNFVFPPQCYVCKKILESEDGLCFECLSKINFITKPRCSCCGIPFEFNIEGKNKKLLCPKCMLKYYRFDECISSVRYDDISKKIILPFKHGDRTNFAKFMAKIMYTSGKSIIEKSDIIIPVPIHFTRMLKRKYNQSSLLCKFIGKRSNKPVLYSLLIRKHATASQGHFSLTQRKQNILGAFTIKNPDKIKGKNILLIDDVFTTGATVNECSKILKQNGANKVYVLTFARAVK